MKFLAILLFFIVALSSVYSQLILDEDDPETKILLSMMMKAINEHEHANYKFKTVVYSLGGESSTYKIMLKVIDERGVLKNCALNLHDNGHGFFKPANIDCTHANE